MWGNSGHFQQGLAGDKQLGPGPLRAGGWTERTAQTSGGAEPILNGAGLSWPHREIRGNKARTPRLPGLCSPCAHGHISSRAVRASLSLLCAELQDSDEPMKKRNKLEKTVYMGLQTASAVSPHPTCPRGLSGQGAGGTQPWAITWLGCPVEPRLFEL